ncbi:sialomucin core protein 24-like [Hetaerina americana]|uniref:sialomucin core protein 24-like n=1 Tax=Hetaerina americana TaxID=62018 RepID=UPI003A7F57B8
MNRVSFIACLWLLGGMLLTYGLPTGCCSPVTIEPAVPNPSIAVTPINGKVVDEGTQVSSAGKQPDTVEKQGTTGAVPVTLNPDSNTTVTPHTPTSTIPTSPNPPATKSTVPPQTTTLSTPPTSTTTTTIQPPTTAPTTTTPVTTPSTTHVVPTSVIPNSTQNPEPTKPTSAPETDRRFDGPSFIGGIVFALGVTAIGFVAWKFYKARTERNYHTL